MRSKETWDHQDFGYNEIQNEVDKQKRRHQEALKKQGHEARVICDMSDNSGDDDDDGDVSDTDHVSLGTPASVRHSASAGSSGSEVDIETWQCVSGWHISACSGSGPHTVSIEIASVNVNHHAQKVTSYMYIVVYVLACGTGVKMLTSFVTIIHSLGGILYML